MIKNHYHIVRNALPHDLCDYLIVQSFLYNNPEKAKVNNPKGFIENPNVRNTEVVFHPCKSDLGKFFKQNAKTVNKEAEWFFNISRIETIQILKYTRGSFYNRHADLTTPSGIGYHQKQRKISCSLQLNSPSEYYGGGFNLFTFEGQELNMSLNKGDLLLFPSFIPHEVTQVTQGIRYSSTAWIEGLSFR
jgi:predicted 2-oxoglutarate/Fe(II)-dependent dioxygenase YbiX